MELLCRLPDLIHRPERLPTRRMCGLFRGFGAPWNLIRCCNCFVGGMLFADGWPENFLRFERIIRRRRNSGGLHLQREREREMRGKMEEEDEILGFFGAKAYLEADVYDWQVSIRAQILRGRGRGDDCNYFLFLFGPSSIHVSLFDLTNLDFCYLLYKRQRFHLYAKVEPRFRPSESEFTISTFSNLDFVYLG